MIYIYTRNHKSQRKKKKTTTHLCTYTYKFAVSKHLTTNGKTQKKKNLPLIFETLFLEIIL